MATIDLGKIKQVWRGTYNNGTAYTVDDIVEYTDTGITSTYICVANSTGNAPSSGGSAHASWNYMAKGVADPIPSQSGNSGKFLTSNGTAASWGTVSGGITGVDQWRLTNSENYSSHQGWNWGNDNLILDNYWERDDNTNYFEKIGTGMTQSSGVFTFPETGKWLVVYRLDGRTHSAHGNHLNYQIEASTDSGSNWAYQCSTHINPSQPTGAFQYFSGQQETILDVSNASTWRVRFNLEPNANLLIHGSSSYNTTCVSFIRLGDT